MSRWPSHPGRPANTSCGIPVAAHKYTPGFSDSVLHSDIQVLAFPLGQGKSVAKMLPCAIRRGLDLLG